MGYYLKVKGQPFMLYRGKKVESKIQATWYASTYAAETMQLRWEKANPKQKLEIRKWATDEIVGHSVTTAPRTKPTSWRK
jgi:hypothetical protein